MAIPLEPDEPDRTVRKPAWLQLLFGQMQIAGPTTGVLLLVSTGINTLTVTVEAGTFAISIVRRGAFLAKTSSVPG